MKRLLIAFIFVLVAVGCDVEQQRTDCSTYNVDIVVQRSWGGSVLLVQCNRVRAPTTFASARMLEEFCVRRHRTYVILPGGAWNE